MFLFPYFLFNMNMRTKPSYGCEFISKSPQVLKSLALALGSSVEW